MDLEISLINNKLLILELFLMKGLMERLSAKWGRANFVWNLLINVPIATNGVSLLKLKRCALMWIVLKFDLVLETVKQL